MSARSVLALFHDVLLSCRCVISFERERLFRLVPGAAVWCPRHGPRTLLSRCPRPDPWERTVRRVAREASRD